MVYEIDTNPLAQHKHFIARVEMDEFFGVDNEEEFKDWFEELVEKLDMNLLSGPHVVYVDRPGLRGWTGVCIIETSHIAIHVWDEKDPILAQLDVYTCGDMNVGVILDMLETFMPSRVDFLVLDREYALDELESMSYVYGADGEEADDQDLL